MQEDARMRNGFPRVYKSFEEFEREELHRLDMSAAIDDMLDEMFAEELDFDQSSVKKSRRREDHDE
jgi:hypothetical protein